jgi:methylated-DNA-[protein]-cysteine S-methyltransferase
MTAAVLFAETLPSPIGSLLLLATERGLAALHMELQRYPPEPAAWRRDPQRFSEVRRQLSAYFGGELREFTVALDAQGTPFQERVWAALRQIPFGETTSYGELARKLGDPHASRAVGLANGRNPIGILVPCHRVVGVKGDLTGYAGGIERKRWLLAHEARQRALL